MSTVRDKDQAIETGDTRPLHRDTARAIGKVRSFFRGLGRDIAKTD